MSRRSKSKKRSISKKKPKLKKVPVIERKFKKPDYAGMSEEEFRIYLEDLRSGLDIESEFPDLAKKSSISPEEAKDLHETMFRQYTYIYMFYEEYINALLEFSNRGFKFIPLTWDEKKQLALENIDNLKSFWFEDRGFFKGIREFTIYFTDLNQKKADIRFSVIPKMTTNEKIIVGECTKEDIRNLLNSINLREWDKTYEDDTILNGTQWNLTLEFHSNLIPKLCIFGSNDFPPTYQALYDFFFSMVPDEIE